MTSRLQVRAEGRLDLGIGQPDLRLLPLDELRSAAGHRLAIRETDLLQYGPERGSEPMRRLLAGFLADGYGLPIDPERLFITGGASHGLDLILSRFTREGDTILVEEPTYFLARRILDGRRLRVLPVPTDARGLDTRALAAVLEHERPKLIYTIPIHHNPTGVTLIRERRAELVALARAHDFLIVADEVYQLLTYEGPPPPPMQTLDRTHVLSLGSFSKILAPGLRLGWIDADPAHIDALSGCGVLRSGGGASPFTAAIVESALETGLLADYLARVREVYRRRCHTLITAIEAELPRSVTFERPTGGFFVWLQLPEGSDATALLQRAHAEKVGFLPGARCSAQGGLRDRVRLCFTYFDEVEIPSAIRRLAKIMN